MEDYIAEKQQARRDAFDHLTANPAINTVAISGLVVDKQGFEHVRPDSLERNMMLWLGEEWGHAIRNDTGSAWDRLVDVLYGALQACNSHGKLHAAGAYISHIPSRKAVVATM